MTHLKIICLLLAAILGSHALYARLQGREKIDSLLKELPKAKEDTNKLKLLDDLSWEYASSSADKGLTYAQMELELATKLSWNKGIANANIAIGKNYTSAAKYLEAVTFAQKALNLYEKNGDKNGMAKATNQLGVIAGSQGNLSGALEYYTRSKDIYEETGNRKGAASAMNNIAFIYVSQSNYTKALEYAFKAMAIQEEIGNKSGVLSAANNIGDAYTRQGEYPKALAYFSKALKLAEELENKDLIAAGFHAIGNNYANQKNNAKALEYCLKALEMHEETGRKRSVANTSGDIGIIYIDMRNYALGLTYLQRALTTADEIGDRYERALILTNIGTLYHKVLMDTAVRPSNVTNRIDLSENRYRPSSEIPKGRQELLHIAIDYFERGLIASSELHASDLSRVCYEGLTELYKLKGDYKNAMKCADSARIIKDSIFSQQNRDKIANLEDARKQLTDSLKNADAQKAADIKAAHRRNYELIGGAAFLLLLVFTVLLTKKNTLLDKEKKDNENLLHNILPEEVATELKATGTTTAKHYDNVTVLFTDFVNFTQAAELLNPQGLIDELHACFKAFDEITGKYNIEKIKTIGDAYLAVCGLPTADPKHAEKAVSAAKEINAFMADRLAKLGSERTFAVRIGIHSGSVVAGIVGVKKFAYDIWGDTVNTAARMEQNSEAGKINISETTYELVKDKFSCEYRGEVEAKGKGVMKMYFVS